jgi:hypothetical protein
MNLFAYVCMYVCMYVCASLRLCKAILIFYVDFISGLFDKYIKCTFIPTKQSLQVVEKKIRHRVVIYILYECGVFKILSYLSIDGHCSIV